MLGPLLLMIFLNDIVRSSSLLKFTIYADDAVLYLSSENLQDLVDLFNREIITTYHWIISNKLTLNINKTKAIIFSRGVVNLNGISELKILDKKVEIIKEIKFLGVIITSNLSWKSHMNFIVGKISKINSILYLTRNYICQKSLKQIYYSLVYPYLTYCNIICSSTYKNCLNPLILSQKRIIRTITFSRRYDHTDQLFQRLKIFKFEKLRIYCISQFVYKALNGVIDLPNFFTYASDIHGRELRDMFELRHPQFRSTQSRQSIAFTGCTVWNNLHTDLQAMSSLNSFKSSLKNSLLS